MEPSGLHANLPVSEWPQQGQGYLQGLQGSLRTQRDESQLGGEDWGSNLALSAGSEIVAQNREEHYLTWKNLLRAPWICDFIWGVWNALIPHESLPKAEVREALSRE